MTHPTFDGLEITIADAVATLRIANGKANSVDPPLIKAMLTALDGLVQDEDVRCIVVTGTGRIFVSGADIRVMRSLKENVYVAMRRWVEVQRMIELAPKPVIAALNGHALGGGAELSLACDLRILHAAARIGFPETDLGIFPGAGGSQRLPRLIGAHRAKRLIIDGTKLTSDEALALGLVDIVAGDDFQEVVAAESKRLASRPTATIGLLKAVIDGGRDLPIDAAIGLEGEYVRRNLQVADAAEGLQAFLDKRPPTFTGR